MFDLVLVGVGIILVGFAVLLMAAVSGPRGIETKVKGGGVVLIGPIPIIFGSDAKWASVAVLLAIVLILLVIVLGGLCWTRSG